MFNRLLVWFLLPIFPSDDSTSDSTGIIVVLIEFTIIVVNSVIAVRAIKNVSVSTPDPNLAAISISLINPRILLPNEKIIIIKTDFAALFDCDKVTPPKNK